MWINYLLSALSGVTYILACAPGDQYYLMWVAFIPLLIAIERVPVANRTYWMSFKLGLTSAFFMSATGFYWLIHATESYGGLPYSVAFLVYLAFCLTNQLPIPLYIMLRQKLRTSSWFQNHMILPALLLGVVYAGIESFYPKLFVDTVGSAFYRASWTRQLADLGGPMVITVVGIMVNELLFTALSLKKIKGLILPVAIGIAICAYGFMRTEQFETLKSAHQSDPVFRTAMVQGNIGDFMKVAAERGEANAVNQVLGKYLSLSEQAAKEPLAPDAIIWPETAYPAIFERPFSQTEMAMDRMLKGFLAQAKGYLIFGGYDNDIRGLEYNSVFFLKGGTAYDKQVYHKSVLLMFGETLPFAEYFPSMKSWFPTMGFFGRGPGPETYTLKNSAGDAFKFAPSICYEGLFEDHSMTGALMGADALLNVTNDSWFGEHGEPYQHLSLTRFRTIETRLPMIRATNTGFTVWIDPTGDQLKSTEISKADVLTAEIQRRLFPESPYMVMSKIFGTNYFVHLCEILTVALLLFLQFAKQKQKIAQR
jgi:apolipoprotein N-acyltransferase